jgi:hypothetical protein
MLNFAVYIVVHRRFARLCSAATPRDQRLELLVYDKIEQANYSYYWL